MIFDENASAYSFNLAAVLADGSAIAMDTRRYITIDIDGVKKGPNLMGWDTFQFYLEAKEGLLLNRGCNVQGSPSAWFVCKDEDEKSFDLVGVAGSWVILFGNMDYLKTKDGRTCPDGKTKLDSVVNHSCK